LRATAPDGKASVVLKVYDTVGAAETQFNALSNLANHTGRIVKPDFLSTAHNLFAMQDAGPVTLDHTTAQDAGRTTTRRALQWLDGFCRDTPQQTLPFDMMPHLALAQRETEYMPERFQAAAPRVLSNFRQLLTPFHGRSVLHCTSFNDLKPQNLCVDPETGRITGIDYLPGPPQPIARDAAFLLNWMDQNGWRESLRTGGLLRPRDNSRRRAIALDTLGAQLDPALLDAFRYGFLISTWHKFAYFKQSAHLIRTAEVHLGLRHRATLLRPFLGRIFPLLR